MADFAVLAEDPYDVGAEGLRDIAVKGVVFEGEAHPL
jgi:predicted amidohydrolase YtcJ